MEKFDLKQNLAFSHLLDGNFAYIEQLYEAYLKNPDAVEETWRSYFDDLRQTQRVDLQDVNMSEVRDYFIQLARNNHGAVAQPRNFDYQSQLSHERKQAQIYLLINAYRTHGHQRARLDPLGMEKRPEVPDLLLNFHGFSHADLETTFDTGNFIGPREATLKSIYNALNYTYCDTIGAEFMYITNVEEITWIQQRLESVHAHPAYSPEVKQRIFKQLVAAEGLEKYLGMKYVGQKRFSLEGGASLIPMLDELVQRSGAQGVKELIIGMAHRGRLNVLVNILGKSPQLLFREFEGKPRSGSHSGDVKYHLGFSSDVKTSGGVIHLALAFNPSHLEIINPVVEGSVRARQERRVDQENIEIVPILVHGDAAFIGQGVVMETFSLSQARGYKTGGTVHIVINNQIGFTTSNPLDARSSPYCTDVAKIVQAPVFHVNGDDPEACLFVTQLALDYRMTFKKDVVIDLVCYRRHGHNEADEPAMTQPNMYRIIRQHPYTSEIYAERLIAEKVLTKEENEQAYNEYRAMLDAGHTVVEVVPKGEGVQFLADWRPYKDQVWTTKVKTGVPLKTLETIANQLEVVPEGFTLHPQVEKEYEARKKMALGELPLNWGFAETLAYATLLTEGYPIRLSGQDSGRGTFSHRHAVLHDVNDDNVYIPLCHLANGQANFAVIDSVLSEEAVVGFEYGYATTDPDTLVIWEAQFGDFGNGAQVVIDQFISSGEQKWNRLCGLTMFLPHGYEGQGPEHSSARLERYLQLCAQKNIQVCVPSTPSQFFHMIRRQLLRPYRKPLIVMTPKSLLRHKVAVSSLQDLVDGEFQLLIPEVDDIGTNDVRRVVLCSGKVYYDLLQQRRSNNQKEVAILRIEQLYPFPLDDLSAALHGYKNAKEIIWCQEEPQNQGAWHSTRHRIQECLAKGQKLHYVGRLASASPATGYTSLHLEQQAALVNEALNGQMPATIHS